MYHACRPMHKTCPPSLRAPNQERVGLTAVRLCWPAQLPFLGLLVVMNEVEA